MENALKIEGKTLIYTYSSTPMNIARGYEKTTDFEGKISYYQFNFKGQFEDLTHNPAEMFRLNREGIQTLLFLEVGRNVFEGIRNVPIINN